MENMRSNFWLNIICLMLPSLVIASTLRVAPAFAVYVAPLFLIGYGWALFIAHKTETQKTQRAAVWLALGFILGIVMLFIFPIQKWL